MWVGNNAVGVECHISPSSSEYVETDVSTGRTVPTLMGFDFEPSPDTLHIAHEGWMPHFVPPYEQSFYLLIDRTYDWTANTLQSMSAGDGEETTRRYSHLRI